MKQTVYLSDFRQAFKDMNRQEQFSHYGLEALFNWLESYDHMGDGAEYELDVIALCCEYSESTLEEIANDHCISETAVIAYLENNTWFEELPNGSFLYQNF